MGISRRTLLGVTAASAATLAGYVGKQSEDLRFRNVTPDTQTLIVRIWGPDGAQVVDEGETYHVTVRDGPELRLGRLGPP